MITYRPALTADAAGIVSLLTEIMRHHGVRPPDDDRLTVVVDAVFLSPDHFFLVADNGGTVVGMCALIFSYSTWSTGLVCELQDVIVTADRRRRQVGRGLIETAETIARERGCSRLFLTAESWNLDGQRFYRSLGLAEKVCLYYERDLRDGPDAPDST